jgi:hypothetical protein
MLRKEKNLNELTQNLFFLSVFNQNGLSAWLLLGQGNEMMQTGGHFVDRPRIARITTDH